MNVLVITKSPVKHRDNWNEKAHEQAEVYCQEYNQEADPKVLSIFTLADYMEVKLTETGIKQSAKGAKSGVVLWDPSESLLCNESEKQIFNKEEYEVDHQVVSHFLKNACDLAKVFVVPKKVHYTDPKTDTTENQKPSFSLGVSWAVVGEKNSHPVFFLQMKPFFPSTWQINMVSYPDVDHEKYENHKVQKVFEGIGVKNPLRDACVYDLRDVL